MDIARCLLLLAPGAEFIARGDAIEWIGPGAQPTLAECEAIWPQIVAQDEADAQAAATATTNERTIGQALDAALANNQAAIAALVAWRTTGPGAGTANLTAAQMSAALRTAADNQVTAFRQLNGLIRLVRRNLATADLSSAVKA